jgi:hypothetical protein
LIFGGSPINTSRGLCSGICSKRVDIPLEKDLPMESLRGLEVEVIEFTINNVEEFLEVIHPIIYHKLFFISAHQINLKTHKKILI